MNELRDWLIQLMEELEEDSSGDWGSRDPEGVGWERACKHYADRIRAKLAETTRVS
jgi:hypothetical protein